MKLVVTVLAEKAAVVQHASHPHVRLHEAEIAALPEKYGIDRDRFYRSNFVELMGAGLPAALRGAPAQPIGSP